MTVSLRVELAVDGLPVRVWARGVESPYLDLYRPMDVCDNALVALCVRGGATEGTAELVRVRRRHYAKLLAGHIADAIVRVMEQEDRYNGYPIEEER